MDRADETKQKGMLQIGTYDSQYPWYYDCDDSSPLVQVLNPDMGLIGDRETTRARLGHAGGDLQLHSAIAMVKGMNVRQRSG